jgi:uncharacterized membrane protein
MEQHEKAFILITQNRNREEKKMTFETSKTLGGIGAILMFIGIFPIISYYGIVEIIGAILVVVALHGLADYYKEGGIFSNALYGILVGIVGVVVTVVAALITVLTSLTDLIKQIYPSWNGDWSTLQGMTPDASNINPSAVFPLLAGILVILVIVWVFAIIASFFIWRSLKQVSNKSSIGLFGTAGLLLLVGAIIPLIGLILMWISLLLLAIAFFTMKPQSQQTPPLTPPPQPTTV